MFSRCLLLAKLLFLFLLTACGSPEVSIGKLSIGVISYNERRRSTERYQPLADHLARTLKTMIELEPVYNEVKALEQIKQRDWDIVFAPPGLAAIAISEAQYLPLLPLAGVKQTRSVILVLQESAIQELSDLSGRVVALGQPGSATGYYLPLYNLYGLTLAEVRFAPIPKVALQWLSEGVVSASALSLVEFERHRSDYGQTQFRILSVDKHAVPPGAILVGTTVERNLQEQIHRALRSAPATVATTAGYLTNAKAPDYRYLIEVVERVQPIAERVREQPAPLYEASVVPTL